MTTPGDADLLRRFEPVIRYTRGEHFFPMDVEPYVRACSLWVQRPDANPACLVPEGQLTLERLAEPRPDVHGAVHFLKFIEPLNIAELTAYALQQGLARKDPRDVFQPGHGRLARVGYGSRFVDALFSLTLLARGRVPGDTAAAAALEYTRLLKDNERHVYYGRVVREAGWLCLQYWFFYPFNNWRSGFFGVNDHESDWEMIYLYLSEAEATGEVKPEWVAYASHDFSGDDLRRRWDDPEVEKVGEHPVIYSGAGSHASYFSRGEYLAEIELPFLSPLVRLVDKAQALLRKMLQRAQGAEETERAAEFNVFRIPFVDYARGDGVTLGAGGDKVWAEPQLLQPAPAWAVGYRGLWGLYAHDPISGENAPAGPVYNRDGSMRRSWYDPLGWAGLDKVPPPDEALARIADRRAQLDAQSAELRAKIEQKQKGLLALGVDAAAMHDRPHLKNLYKDHAKKIAALSKELEQARAQLAAGEALAEALGLHAARVRSGQPGPLRAHIHRAHRPASEAGHPLSVLAEWWAAISIGLMMVGFVLIVLFARPYLLWGLTGLIALIGFVEAGFRRQLANLITSLTIALAVVCALVIMFEFFWTIVILGVLVAGGYIMWENLRELRG